MTEMIDQAFILAAGRGTRLRPYTDTLPKPMVPLVGEPIIDRVIEQLKKAQIVDIAVNLHYRADILKTHLDQKWGPDNNDTKSTPDAKPSLHYSHEKDLLETGGGIKHGMALLRDAPFFVVSGDSLWTDGPKGPALKRMQEMWDPARMDILILLQPVTAMTLSPGVGDYDLDPEGRALRQPDKTGAYMWTSVRICNPEIFKDTPDSAFSFLQLLDQAEEKGRLYGLVHDGAWYHITTPADLDRVNQALDAQKLYA